MLRNPDSCRYDDIVADAVLEVVRVDGAAALTLRSVARHIGVSPPALVNRYGGRDRVLEVALRTIVDRWSSGQAYRWRRATTGAHDRAAVWAALLVGEDDEDLAELPAWLVLLALACADPGRRFLGRRVKDEERAMVVATLGGREAVPGDADLVLATLDGLRSALADPTAPLHLEQAHRVLARLSDALGTGDAAEVA